MLQPLANDVTGTVFELAEGARVWRVQKMTGRRGTQEVLFDGSDQPLSVPIDATPAELRAAIEGAGYAPAGRFKLVPCDKNGVQVGDKCGYITLKGEVADDERGGGSASDAAISKMADAVTRAVEKREVRVAVQLGVSVHHQS